MALQLLQQSCNLRNYSFPPSLWLCHKSLDPDELNPRLTEWLIEYNFNRPHQSLAYLTPAEYIEEELAKIHSPVLPMWSASTRAVYSN